MIRSRRGLRRKTGVRKSNPKRRKSEFARCYHSEERVLWVKHRSCAVQCCGGSLSENAHAKGGGAGRKAGYKLIVPLCFTHHDRLHNWGAQSFQLVYGINLLVEAAATHAAWLASTTEESR